MDGKASVKEETSNVMGKDGSSISVESKRKRSETKSEGEGQSTHAKLEKESLGTAASLPSKLGSSQSKLQSILHPKKQSQERESVYNSLYFAEDISLTVNGQNEEENGSNDSSEKRKNSENSNNDYDDWQQVVSKFSLSVKS